MIIIILNEFTRLKIRMNYGKAVVDKNFCGIPVMKEDISLDGNDFYCNMNKNTNYVNREKKKNQTRAAE